jgi:hypothetical protein
MRGGFEMECRLDRYQYTVHDAANKTLRLGELDAAGQVLCIDHTCVMMVTVSLRDS